MKNQAFTLILLLVVVLIICILAAIAVKKKKKAVMKAQSAEALINLKTLKRAQERYYLANGKYTTDLTQLDLNFNESIYKYRCIKENIIDCYANRVDGLYPSFEQTEQNLYCRGGKKDCEAFSNKQATTAGYWIVEE